MKELTDIIGCLSGKDLHLRSGERDSQGGKKKERNAKSVDCSFPKLLECHEKHPSVGNAKGFINILFICCIQVYA